MLRVLFLLFLVKNSFSIICPSGYTPNSNKCLKFFDTPLSYPVALDSCRQNKGNLVTIKNAIDNAAIASSYSNRSDVIWLGLNCEFDRDPSSCHWDDKYNSTAGNFSSFNNGYPLISAGKCVYMFTKGTFAGRWVSADCNSTSLAYICESNILDFDCEHVYNGACYFPVTNSLTQDDAQKECQQIGANLVSIHSKEENQYLTKLMQTEILESTRIGAILSTTGKVSWIDNSTFDYNYIGYQNSEYGKSFKMGYKSSMVFDGEWMSCYENSLMPYICKRANWIVPTTVRPSVDDCSAPHFYDNGYGNFGSPNYPLTYVGVPGRVCEYFVSADNGTNALIRFPLLSLDPKASITLYNSFTSATPFQTLNSTSIPNLWYSSTSNQLRIVYQPCYTNCDTKYVHRWLANYREL